MGDRRLKEDGVYNISTSIFVTNFPDQTNAKELWRLCNQYGNVIDSFIPDRRFKVELTGWAPNYSVTEDASDSDDESVDSKLVDNHKESPLENDSESEETKRIGRSSFHIELVGENSSVSDYFVAIMGKWRPNNKNLLIISVYAPQDLAEKKMLWQYLNILIDRWNGDVIVMGDFNEVHHKDERYGSIFNARGADAFNSFISAGGLVEVPSGGYSFTWSHNSASKMSKLDRFLVYDNLQRTCPNLSSLTLDRFLSDHRPILLQINTEYGPHRFIFHNWFYS
ncbi:RNA-directed DNA polymerase, eukaryota [Tanacetum coccineum]